MSPENTDVIVKRNPEELLGETLTFGRFSKDQIQSLS